MADDLQRENEALRTLIEQVLSIPVTPCLTRLRERHPTFYGVSWEDILADPVSFYEQHHLNHRRNPCPHSR